MIGYEIFKKLKVRYKTGEQFKILFCPYKNSMWDSMETIWEKAVQDDETTTNVMPIPFFTLNELKPQKIHMEFPQFNSFPEVLNEGWDVILIHYPYDQRNTITRPLLTSYMLKFFCRHLVFLNYAVIGNKDVVKMEAQLPALCNADLVIAENERIAEQTKAALEEINVHNEVVPWGSPKYDKLCIPYELPDEWKDKVEGKRVILFQTSIVPYMRNPHKIMQIDKVLKEYMEKDDVCLWWRPHPLYEETILAHRPLEIKKWEDMKNRVKKSRHIFDDTPDLHRAISMTDEMITDTSSVVILYEYTGKKITMLED